VKAVSCGKPACSFEELFQVPEHHDLDAAGLQAPGLRFVVAYLYLYYNNNSNNNNNNNIYIYAYMCRGMPCTEFRQKSANDNGLVELTDMFADDTNILV
jgi:hypothetical protein